MKARLVPPSNPAGEDVDRIEVSVSGETEVRLVHCPPEADPVPQLVPKDAYLVVEYSLRGRGGFLVEESQTDVDRAASDETRKGPGRPLKIFDGQHPSQLVEERACEVG